MNSGRLFALAWRLFVRLPDAVGRALLDAVAIGAWVTRSKGVRGLERNLARVRPDASRRELSRLALAGMRSYMRYYCESFQLPGWTPEQVDARVRTIGDEALRDELAEGRSPVLALGHLGNWDLAGAWATRNLGPVVAVAERLEPEELFREFLAFRESLGITVVPFARGAGVFRELVRHARKGGSVIPLLADRDLSRNGLVVDLVGHPARVAPGPAALALATRNALHPTTITYERLTGARRRRAHSPWGIVIEFHLAVPVPTDTSREAAIATMTQAWVDVLGRTIAERPEDWHMLQRVFVADLRPARTPEPTDATGSAPS